MVAELTDETCHIASTIQCEHIPRREAGLPPQIWQ